MNKWRCKICGFIHEGDSPPNICPVCGAGSEDFVLMEKVVSEAIEENMLLAI